MATGTLQKFGNALVKKPLIPIVIVILVGAGVVGSIWGSSHTTGGDCGPAKGVAAAKESAPGERIGLSEPSVLTIDFGHNRGSAKDATELVMKGTGLPSGEVAIGHSLLERASGTTAHIDDDAIKLSASANGARLTIRLCVDTRKAPAQPGVYVASAFITDQRFAGDVTIPISVTLQSQQLYRVGTPLVLGALIGGVWLAGMAAGQKSTSFTGAQIVAVIAVIAIATGEFSSTAIGNPSFGEEPLVQWAGLAWRIGAAVLAAATVVFAGEQAFKKKPSAGQDNQDDGGDGGSLPHDQTTNA